MVAPDPWASPLKIGVRARDEIFSIKYKAFDYSTFLSTLLEIVVDIMLANYSHENLYREWKLCIIRIKHLHTHARSQVTQAR
jgi:hypothetical protein